MDSRHLRLGSGVGAEEGYMSNNTINGNYCDVQGHPPQMMDSVKLFL